MDVYVNKKWKSIKSKHNLNFMGDYDLKQFTSAMNTSINELWSVRYKSDNVIIILIINSVLRATTKSPIKYLDIHVCFDTLRKEVRRMKGIIYSVRCTNKYWLYLKMKCLITGYEEYSKPCYRKKADKKKKTLPALSEKNQLH